MANMTFKASLLPSSDLSYSLGSSAQKWKINDLTGGPVEYIVGTQTAATGSWTGVTKDGTLTTGKVIAYKLPFAGSGSASLTLTFTNPIDNTKTNSGAVPVYLNGDTRATTHYIANSVILMVYDGASWRSTDYWNSNSRDAGYGSIALAQSTATTGVTTNTTTPTAKTYNEKITLAAGNKWVQFAGTNSNTAGSDVLTVGHSLSGATAGNYGDSAAQAPAHGGTFNVPYISVDAAGHITSISSHTVKIPATTVSNAWTAGTTAGPAIQTTVNGVTGDAVAIPSASATASGVITTGDQTLKGNKTLQGRLLLTTNTNISKTFGTVLEIRQDKNTTTDTEWPVAIKNNYNSNTAGGWGTGLKLALGSESEEGKWAGIRISALSSYANQTSLDFYATAALRAKITNTAFLPAATETYNIGSTDLKWSNVYANKFKGTADVADALTDEHTFITNLEIDDTGSFNGTQDVTVGVSGVLPVKHGGTGQSTLTSTAVYVGNTQNAMLETAVKITAAGAVTGVTTLTASGQIKTTATTAATSTTTGAIVAGGGIGAAGNLWVGGTGNFAGAVSITNTTASTSTTSGALKVSGGVGVAGQMTATRVGVNGSNTSYNLYVNGSSNLNGNTTVKTVLGTSNSTYGTSLPSSGTTGQLFFQLSDGINTAGKVITTAATSSTKYYVIGAIGTGAVDPYIATANASGTKNTGGVYFQGSTGVLFGAAWNDYAEYREMSELYQEIPYGRVVIENGDDRVKLSTDRLQPCGQIVSDTFGFILGPELNSLPVALCGRVLAYPLEDRNSFEVGDAVCSGPNGTISKMTREEIREWPDRILGYVSSIPQYDVWKQQDIEVKGRIWIKVK